ncbi:hypothetical protein COLO4_08937 [Corchorus olitorius]|uniref:Uncharacterized protein n=1 Tax=Corchorus olitorius TaxID=93759 RepID=A0A1R3KDY9_9ROSI|nr:hypothetical protein COLO4_08937 [Corchorus olitorius]
MTINKGGNLIDIDRKGFETWKCISEKERQPYVTQAEENNSAYTKLVALENYIYFPERPEKYLGDLATWERSEATLTEALNESGKQ